MLADGWRYTLSAGQVLPAWSWWHTAGWLDYERLVAGRPGRGYWVKYNYVPRPANDVGGRPVYRSAPRDPRAWASKRWDGWRDDGWPTQVLDLAHTSPADRWRAVRRSYKSLIHRAQRTTRLLVWDNTLPADAAVEACRRLHVEAAGRETRPRETWALMADWIHEGYGMLVLALEGGPTTPLQSTGKPRGTAVAHGVEAVDGASPSPSTISPHGRDEIGPGLFVARRSTSVFQCSQPGNVRTHDGNATEPAISADVLLGWAYVYTYQGWAYYGHAVNKHPDVGPAIQWTAIEALAARGDITHYELGWQQPTDDPKEQAIQFFKRGFGGDLWWQPILTPEAA